MASAGQLSTIYEYQARRQRSLHDYPAGIQSYLRSIEICRSVLAVNPTHQPCLRQIVIDDSQLGELYALSGDRENAVKRAEASLARAEKVAASGAAAAISYAPRGLTWAGDVYALLAADTHAAMAQRRADWTQAASYYGQAQVRWNTVPPELRKQWAKEEQRLREQMALSQRQMAVLR